MNIMRKIIGVLAVLLICTAFVGAGAAFTYSSDAVVTPAGSLTPGQKVTATMKIVVTGGSVDASDRITLSTPLTSEDFPEPETPVTQVNVPSGIKTVGTSV